MIIGSPKFKKGDTIMIVSFVDSKAAPFSVLDAAAASRIEEFFRDGKILYQLQGNAKLSSPAVAEGNIAAMVAETSVDGELPKEFSTTTFNSVVIAVVPKDHKAEYSTMHLVGSAAVGAALGYALKKR